MHILISGDKLSQCKDFERYLKKNINQKLQISIINNFYSKRVKNPNELSLYKLNLYLMYSTLCSKNFNSFIQSLIERTHRLNILRYLYLTFLKKFLAYNPKLYLFLYKLLWDFLIYRYTLVEKVSFLRKRNKSNYYHFHLGCFTTNVEIDTCIKSKINKNKIIYLPYNWDNINSKSFIPINFFENVMSWDPIITNNFPRYLLGKTRIEFTSSFRLDYLMNINLKRKNNTVVFFGTQKDIPHELEKIIKIKKLFDKYYLNYELIYRPHPYAMNDLNKFCSNTENLKSLISLKISLAPENIKLLNNNNRLNFDLRSFKDLLEISKVSISPGSTSLMESALNGNVCLLLITNPIQDTLKLMHQKDHILSLLTLPETYICPSVLILKKKLDEVLLNKEIDHKRIRETALSFFRPEIFKNSLKNIISN